MPGGGSRIVLAAALLVTASACTRHVYIEPRDISRVADAQGDDAEDLEVIGEDGRRHRIDAPVRELEIVARPGTTLMLPPGAMAAEAVPDDLVDARAAGGWTPALVDVRRPYWATAKDETIEVVQFGTTSTQAAQRSVIRQRDVRGVRAPVPDTPSTVVAAAGAVGGAALVAIGVVLAYQFATVRY